MIIAFSGAKFAGKDTAAEILIKGFGFKRIGLADKLKDICSEVFEMPREDMDNPEKKESPFANRVSITIEHIDSLLRTMQRDGFEFDQEKVFQDVLQNFQGRILTSIRDMLQTIGTDICRTYVADDIWLQYVAGEVKNPYEKFVITDARFKNERDFFKKLGATLVLIKRNSVQNNSTHISENQLGEDSDYDVIMTNNETIYALQQSVQMWYQLKNKYEIMYQYKK